MHAASFYKESEIRFRIIINNDAFFHELKRSLAEWKFLNKFTAKPANGVICVKGVIPSARIMPFEAFLL